MNELFGVELLTCDNLTEHHACSIDSIKSITFLTMLQCKIVFTMNFNEG